VQGELAEVVPARQDPSSPQDQRSTAIGQNQNEMQSTLTMYRSKNVERPAFERMASTNDGHSLRKGLMMGSVSWLPLTRCRIARLYLTMRKLDRDLAVWAKRKYRKLRQHLRRATHWIARLSRRAPELFAHWQMGERQGSMMGAV
jgi:hypothetical protein